MQHGWTLVELLIVLAIATLIIAAAVPNYRDWIASAQLANAAQQLASSMSFARSEAIKRGQRVGLCRSSDRLRCNHAAGWGSGWLVFVDVDNDGLVSDGEPLLRVETPPSAGTAIAGNRPVEEYVSYTSLGAARMVSGALQMGTFTVCRSGLKAMHVVLANSGRVRVETSRDLCP